MYLHTLSFFNIVVLLVQFKQSQIEWNPFPQPRRPLRMVPLIFAFHGVRMHQGAQRPAIDHQPRDERSELCGREQVDLEHSDGVWADGTIEECVDAEFGNC